jgi:hypothetical protein
MTCFLVIMLDDAHDHVLAISNIWDVTPACYGGLIGSPIDSRPEKARAYSSQIHPVGPRGYLPFFKGIPWTDGSQDLITSGSVRSTRMLGHWS